MVHGFALFTSIDSSVNKVEIQNFLKSQKNIPVTISPQGERFYTEINLSDRSAVA
jgi:hypothetical protein